MLLFVILTNILLLTSLIAILSQSLTKVRYLAAISSMLPSKLAPRSEGGASAAVEAYTETEMRDQRPTRPQS